MSQLEHSKKYLEARLEEGLAKPHLNRYTNAVYSRFIAVIENTPDDYAKEIGDMFELMQAEEMDRQANFRDLFTSLGNFKRANSHGKLFEAIKESTGFGDLFMKKSAVNQELGNAFSPENEKRKTLIELMNYLTLYARSLPQEQEHRKQLVKIAWYELMEMDGALSWEKLKTEPSYRYCLYHSDTHLDFLEPYLNTALS